MSPVSAHRDAQGIVIPVDDKSTTDLRWPPRDAYVVTQRLSAGGVVSGVLFLIGVIATVVALVTAPWWLVGLFERAASTDAVPIGILTGVVIIALPLCVTILAKGRPGNAALRRRILAMSADGIWFYRSPAWWRGPTYVPWDEVASISAFAEQTTAPEVTGRLTATLDEIVAKAREFRPQLTVADERDTA